MHIQRRKTIILKAFQTKIQLLFDSVYVSSLWISLIFPGHLNKSDKVMQKQSLIQYLQKKRARESAKKKKK